MRGQDAAHNHAHRVTDVRNGGEMRLQPAIPIVTADVACIVECSFAVGAVRLVKETQVQ